MKKSFFYSILALSTASIITGCGGGGGDSIPTTTQEAVSKITGNIIGNGYAKNDALDKFLKSVITPLYAGGLEKPDKIVVITNITYDEASDKMFMKKYEFSIEADGSFNIDLSKIKEKKLVVLVVNSATKRVYGNLNLGADDNEKLDVIDKSKLIANLDIGTIDSENGCKSDATIESVNAFAKSDIEILKEIAKLDNGLITYSNYYRNSDKDEIPIDSTLQYEFKVDSLDSIISKFNDLSGFGESNLHSKNVTVSSNRWAGVSPDDIKIFPPAKLKYKELATHQFTGEADSTHNIPYEDRGCDDIGSWKGCGFAPIDSFPEGDWIVKVQGKEYATFEFKDVEAFDKAGKLKVPVPKVKVNVENSKVKSIEVQWYVWNGREYIKASDDMMDTVATPPDMTHPQVSIAYNNDSDGVDITANKWNTTFDVKEDIDINSVDRVEMEYNIGQIRYYFQFRN